MLCYFDSDDNVNLSHIDHIKSVRSLRELKERLSNSNLEFITSTDYSSPGLYIIEVSKIPILWCAKTFPTSFNLLLNIPSKVIKSAKDRNIRIVIISIVEGDNFVSEELDGFYHLHNTMKLLGLPKKSVCIVSGNLNAAAQYTEWCNSNNTQEYIEFLEGVEWDGKASNQFDAPIDIPDYGFYFNSLNRAHRKHRSDHLYFLAENKLLNKSLVSGGEWFSSNMTPTYIDVDSNHYNSVLSTHYPRSVDVSDIVNNVPNLINNETIYRQSQLTVVTESHFDQQGGMFITEKTFRPILVGHPFMILGQSKLLRKLKSWGFETSFEGLDSSYDDIENDNLRFAEFHRVLYNWCILNDEIKRTLIYKWKNTIKHNFEHYKTVNFKKKMFDSVISSSNKYFTEDS